MSTARPEKFLKAIREDNATAIRQIIASAKEDINQLFLTDIGEMLPITYAITLGKTQALSALLEATHLQVTQATHERAYRPLFLAMSENQLECFKILLDDPRVDINATEHMDHQTSLIMSVSLGKKQFFQALLDSKRVSELDVNKRCQDMGDSAIGWACQRSDLFYLQTLLRQPKIIIKVYADRIKKALDNENNPSRAEDLRLFEEAVARGNSDTNENPQQPSSENKVIVNVPPPPDKGMSDMSEQKFVKLRKAIEDNKPDEISQIISSQAEDVINNEFTTEGKPPKKHTLLTYAIACGHTKCLSALLESKDIDVNLKGKTPPLILAMKEDKLDCFTLLLNHPRIDLNARDPEAYSYTPLAYSVSLGKKLYFDALLASPRVQEIEFNTYYKVDYSYPAIYHACLRADPSYLRKLLHQPGIQAGGNIMGASLANLSRAKLDQEKNPSRKKDLTLLNEAIARGEPEQKPIDPLPSKALPGEPQQLLPENKSDETKPNKLLQAINDDNEEEIRQIITSKKEDINKRFTTDDGNVMVPLTYAIAKGKERALKALLEAQDIVLNPNAVIYPPLIFAMHKNQFDCFKILLADPRLDVNASDQSDYSHTPLTYSIFYQKKEYFEALLESKRAQEIDVNKSCSQGGFSTAISQAYRFDLFYLQILLRHPGIKVPEGYLGTTNFQIADSIKSKLDNEQNPSREEDLANLEKAIARGCPNENTNPPVPIENISTTKDPQPPNENKVTTLQTVDSTPPHQNLLHSPKITQMNPLNPLPSTKANISVDQAFL